MKVIVDIGVVPIGAGLSLSKYVAACQTIFREAGLEPRLHAYGTNLEGEWDVVFGAIRRCHEVLHEMGAPRLDRRQDRERASEDRTGSGRMRHRP